ncbi:hypothetical protein KUTeg_011552 [Tegillarca granosa]|uniref:Uncharacterized protein n=1 Tax=Tegillarca granosa TaxID=220873 RepID=A0ABQ9F1E1_TEGGR|nr:hypothetical protein KUTeg_011552 [Tegillarca granosa]
MAAACTQPLVVPMHYDPSFKDWSFNTFSHFLFLVDVRLHEPLLPREVTPADIEIDMMSFCSQLDILCKKEILMQPDGKIEHGKVSSSFTNKGSNTSSQKQSMNSIGCPLLDPYKKSVEENFKAVKATLNNDVDGHKQLTDDQREWLVII